MGSRSASPLRVYVVFIDRLPTATAETRLRHLIAPRYQHQPPPPELLACRAQPAAERRTVDISPTSPYRLLLHLCRYTTHVWVGSPLMIAP